MKQHNKVFIRFSLILIFYSILILVFSMLLNTYKEVLSAFVILTVLVLLIIFFYTRSILEPVEKIKDIIERIFRKEYNHNLLSQSRKNKNVFFNLSEISQRLRRYQDKISVRKEGFFTL
ncbi:MAG: hypothetical protein H8E57_10285 [Candidatus Cloacimonetes bacterium]|nr:hypothetical protein [Candidatus Cloacimonadota bacterium]